jgi:hypothetical protein
MCGVSVSLLFAIVTRLIGGKERFSPEEQRTSVMWRNFFQRNLSCRKTQK